MQHAQTLTPSIQITPTSTTTTIHKVGSGSTQQKVAPKMGILRNVLYTELEKYDEAIHKNAPKAEIDNRLEAIENIFSEYSQCKNEYEKEARVLGLTKWQWSCITIVVAGVNILSSLGALGAAIGTAYNVNNNCTQEQPIIAANTATAALALFSGIVAGIYVLADMWRDNLERKQNAKLDEGKLLSDFLRVYKELKEEHKDDDSKILMDAAAKDAKFRDCTEHLNKIREKTENGQANAERLGSILIQEHPKVELRELFYQQQAIAEQIQNYFETTKLNEIVVEKADTTDSNGPSILKTANAVKARFIPSLDDSYKATPQECIKEYKQNFDILSQTLGFKVTTMYIEQEDGTPLKLDYNEPSHAIVEKMKDS